MLVSCIVSPWRPWNIGLVLSLTETLESWLFKMRALSCLVNFSDIDSCSGDTPMFSFYRVQFCSFEFLECLHSRLIHGWLNLGEVILLETAFFVCQLCLLNFVHKLSIVVFMEFVVVNMVIMFLTSDMRLSKSTFFHMKPSRHGGLEYKLHQGWQATSTDIAVSWSPKPGIGRHLSTKLDLFVEGQVCDFSLQ